MVSFDHYKLEQIPAWVGHNFSIFYASHFLEMPGRNLTRLNTNYLDYSRSPWYTQIIFANISDMHGAGNTSKSNGVNVDNQLTVLRDQLTLLINRLDFERLEIIQNDEISNIVCSNCTTMIPAVAYAHRSCPLSPGACPSTTRPCAWVATIFANTCSSPCSTPGIFIISARPRTRSSSKRGRRSSAMRTR